MKTAFVTGATGLLGSNLVRELLGRGWTVRALVRDRGRAATLLGSDPRLLLVRGELPDVAAFETALAGVDVVFHAAAYFRESYRGGSHWPSLEAVNVEGTKCLVRLARHARVPRFVHVSSIGVLAACAPDGRAVDETLRRDATSTKNDYFRSKILADAVVEETLQSDPEWWAAFILPGFMNGPGDAGPTAAGQTILDYVAGRLPGVVDASFSYVDARDVAWACAEAAERGERGRRYVVAGRRLHLREAYTLLEKITGVASPTRRLPIGVLGVVAALNEVWARATGRAVLIGMEMWRNIREEGPYGLYDSSRAERELAVRFRPVEETLRDAVGWMEGRGMR